MFYKIRFGRVEVYINPYNMIIKKILLILLIALSLTPVLAMATDPFTQAQNVAGQLDLPSKTRTISTTPQDIIVNGIRYLLTFIALVLTVSIIFAGWQWMSSGGEADKIEKAKSRLKYSIFGLFIILAGYAVVTFVNKVITAPYQQDVITDCDPNNNGDNDCRNRFGENWYCSTGGNCLFDSSVKAKSEFEDTSGWLKDRVTP